MIMPILPAVAQIGATIDQVFPSDLKGVVGQSASLIGSIDTKNGTFQIYFGTILVATGIAQEFSVSSTFNIPETSAGVYTITLRDAQLNDNATKDFTVNTAYYVTPNLPETPEHLQEGNPVSLNISITGGQPNTVYQANITITVPPPLDANYSRLLTLPRSNQKGTTSTQINYPGTEFQPSGSIIDYAGIYKVYLNETESLAQNQFAIGFTDLTQYHRGQTAQIRAIGYESNDTATVTIKNLDSGATMYSASVTPTTAGVVIAEWTVPSNAAVDNYEVNVTALNTPKLVPDLQEIAVPGYSTGIRAVDLSGTAVAQIVIEATDTVTNKTYDGTTGADGTASINLESGLCTLKAFWNDLQVGETSINVVGEGEFEVPCELVNLKITVTDRNGLLIPSVSLGISYKYLATKTNQQKTGNTNGQTDISGAFTLNSIPPGITYTISASLYGVAFNSGNDTVSDLPLQPVSEVTIICPARSLTFKIVDFHGEAIPNARLALLEITAGIFYGATTDADGSVTVEATLGKYVARVYTGSVLLNETLIEAFADKQIDIQCVLHNFQITLKVDDYFGQPIPDANVRLTGPDGTVQSEKTKADGTAIFGKVTGGDIQVVAYLSEDDNYFEATTIHIESPATIEIRMGRYVIMGAFIVQMSLLLTLVIILPVVAVFLLWEFFRRRRARANKPVMKIGNPQPK